ncbi:hypothetical protein WUBG_04648 [Wuchereria bancrofti]|uniref:Uncharacterized protein n=1 Tax=Wuchereria bancrofti TaxID=6293 RepID=J9F4N7_WUCBA|nr:hypothetical protein WUBG_04648 [Wuchereria bancrofti]
MTFQVVLINSQNSNMKLFFDFGVMIALLILRENTSEFGSFWRMLHFHFSLSHFPFLLYLILSYGGDLISIFTSCCSSALLRHAVSFYGTKNIQEDDDKKEDNMI